MRPKTLALACTLFFLSVPAFAQAPSPAEVSTPKLAPLTLQEALVRAAQANPALRAKQAELAAAEGFNSDARSLLFNNPQLAIDKTRRLVPQAGMNPERRNEWTGGVSQTFETGGQGGFRRETASSALDALRYEIVDAQRQIRSDISTRFYRVLALQQRVELESQALKLFDDAAAAVQKRRTAGEDTKLDANVALVEAERARNQLALAREQLNEERNDLAARLQLVGPALPLAQGELMPAPIGFVLNDLLGSLDAQPRLLAFSAREKSANARYRLERASVSPDVTVGLNVGREGPGSARERLTTISVSIPLPLFKRNATGIGQASTAATQAQIDREAAQRDIKANILSLWTRLTSQEQRVRRLQDVVLPALTDNLSLSVKSRQAGQIGLLELIVVNRQALDARRDLIEALTEYHSTRAAIEFEAGWSKE
ncbi:MULTISPECIES: TolC family protein [unclassified Polaromonas]|jgi:cobalt-zinc-cadmium efflux system outer membrane protein|uniref:TolC family protein n=1 Tax=unclassified Polaromonas TaxID=2638319 RepID=UPI000BCCB6EB|nr:MULTISPECIES: TolC family protein [unclassified Polaromonas]OYY33261.1 MAG: transporter [Polaromonas sp. 35-63-35]OYZ17536.1 MAG: transporter [Polaromonas sp. 16-63-31]OYZ76654.1 MAG: transporter [Polaromonas sp. 24-63-21]OZA47821.1 MAG: transporter [Polaromonas sp. 17-63-33]OZA85858.1 MAG: transporter [Polaromonas sp. 39-63-25]